MMPGFMCPILVYSPLTVTFSPFLPIPVLETSKNYIFWLSYLYIFKTHKVSALLSCEVQTPFSQFRVIITGFFYFVLLQERN